jgi:hypothetical protein
VCLRHLRLLIAQRHRQRILQHRSAKVGSTVRSARVMAFAQQHCRHCLRHAARTTLPVVKLTPRCPGMRTLLMEPGMREVAELPHNMMRSTTGGARGGHPSLTRQVLTAGCHGTSDTLQTLSNMPCKCAPHLIQM